jgi:surface polysaccharide O-acyltransferase-like enzyme
MNSRRYDLDWLRVLAFAVLILYHTGMFYVADWGWHIKSDTTSEALQHVMRLVNPWRMPLLFLISGAALWFAGKKMSAPGLLRLRLIRLLPPLILGMLVIVPPQIYLQILHHEGATFSFSEFYQAYLDLGTNLYPDHQGPIGLMSWTHLWFLPYLLVYTAVFVITKPLLDRLAALLARVNPGLGWLYVVPVASFALYGVFLEPYFPKTYAVAGDWYYHALYFTVFAFGYLMAGQLQIVQRLVSARWLCLGISVVTYTLMMLIEQGGMELSRLTNVVTGCLNGWSWVLTVLAWSAARLNRPSKALSYMNTAILPWYVLHQTITIILAWHLSSLGLPIILEAISVVFGTVAGCALGYELIRRFRLTRFLFGLKLHLTKRVQIPNRIQTALKKC